MDGDLLDSILLCPVPEAEPLVARHRLRLDPSATASLPAHISLLAPFLPADALDRSVRRRLADVLAGIGPFPFRLSQVAGSVRT